MVLLSKKILHLPVSKLLIVLQPSAPQHPASQVVLDSVESVPCKLPGRHNLFLFFTLNIRNRMCSKSSLTSISSTLAPFTLCTTFPDPMAMVPPCHGTTVSRRCNGSQLWSSPLPTLSQNWIIIWGSQFRSSHLEGVDHLFLRLFFFFFFSILLRAAEALYW